MDIPPNEENVKTNVDALKEKFRVYDTILAKQKYLAGEVEPDCPSPSSSSSRALTSLLQEITLADLFHIPACNKLSGLGFDILEACPYPNVAR